MTTPGTIVVRPFHPGEVDAYYAIRLSALRNDPDVFVTTADEFANRPRAMIASQLRQNHDSPHQCMLGAFDGPQAVGMMGVIGNAGGKRRHIAVIVAVYVEVAWRGQGIGGRLLDEAIAQAAAMGNVEQLLLSVIGGNGAAERLYTSRGFRTYGVEPRALKADDRYFDETLMVKFLEQQ